MKCQTQDLACGSQVTSNNETKIVCWGTFVNPSGGNADDEVLTPSDTVQQCVSRRTSNSLQRFLNRPISYIQEKSNAL